MSLELQELLARTAAMHRRLCPRQVLGVRIGMKAGAIFGLDLPQDDKRLFALMETDGCAADGVSVATGCWVGRRTMRVVDYGKVACTFVDTHTERAFRINVNPLARTEASSHIPQVEDAWQCQLLAYQVMPEDKLLEVRGVTLKIPLMEIISQPGFRVTCDRCGEEVINQREVSRGGLRLCIACAGEAYYE